MKIIYFNVNPKAKCEQQKQSSNYFIGILK